MKKLIGRKSVLMCLVGMMVILLGATAQAALIPITGGISFSGGVGFTANTVTFHDDYVTDASGTYAVVPKFTTPVVFTNFTFTALPDVTPLWTFTYEDITYGMNATGAM